MSGATATVAASDADAAWMQLALDEARAAGAIGEVPVGAIVVRDGAVIGRGHNRCIVDRDPSAHAEMVALRDAARAVDNYRLGGAELYVTLEPCAMCAGAIVHARIARVIFAADDPRAGAGGSVMNVLQHEALNHRAAITAAVERETAAVMLRDFFRVRRGGSP
ncbi:MAG: tRNA adenosine(34) deaminase TadA [Gammaproteobacteria bacterium]